VRHYSLEEWADFARNAIGKEESAAMQSHLTDGCKQCSSAVSLWQRVHDAARHEHAYHPPENAVRTIKGTFAIRGPRKAGRGSRAVAAVASLLFDSLRNPLPAGVRSAGSTPRQLLYGVDKYRIDVRMELQSESDKVTVIGQVLNSAEPGSNVGEVPVLAVRRGKTLDESMTSRFGEFRLECDLDGPFQLRIKLPTEELLLAMIEPGIEQSDASKKPTDSKGFKKALERKLRGTRKKV